MRKRQLFLIHFAGGNCYSLRFLASLLKDFDIVTVELPGRGKRMNEPLLTKFDHAAKDIYQQIIQHRNSPDFMLYGHSMGAYLALRVSNMLEKSGRFPAYLVVSGNPGPGITSDDKKRYTMVHNDFIKEIKTLGGVPDEVLENKELFDFFEPILRADFEIAEENGLENEPPVTCPIFAMMGSGEQKNQLITNWGRFTKSDFQSEILEGDHFFINKHPERIAEIIRSCYESISVQTS